MINSQQEIPLKLVEIPCNLCGSNDAKIVYPSTIRSHVQNNFQFTCTSPSHGEYYQLVRCRRCSLHFSSPRPTPQALKEGYGNVEDVIYQEEIDGRVATFKRNLKGIARYKKNGRLLDVGCSIGVFLAQAREAGWEVSGIEPSSWCVKRAKQIFNLDIQEGTTDDLRASQNQFDAVTLWDVLEHVDNPLETLINCRNCLKKDGLFVFSTVDFGSAYVKLLGNKWPWLMRMHIYYFDRNTIKAYLKRSGLDLLEIRVYRHTVSLNYLLYKLNLINKTLYRIAKFFKENILFGKNPYLTIGLGDFMEVYAKRDVSS